MTNLFDLVNYSYTVVKMQQGVALHPAPFPSLHSFELPSGRFSGLFPFPSLPLVLSNLLPFGFRFFRIFSNPENDTDETLTTSGALSRCFESSWDSVRTRLKMSGIDLG